MTDTQKPSTQKASLVSRLPQGLRRNRQWAAALVVAGVSDGVSIPAQTNPIFQVVIDLATAVVLWAVLGWRWGFLIALVPEAIPGLATFPAWVLVVGSLAGLSKFRGEDQAKDEGGGMKDENPKVLSREHLAQEVKRLKDEGKKVVFTNGVFDLLHVGHIRYLQQARSLGDALVIGLNSDVSVKGLKGDKRPILPQDERAELLAALECVDYVCAFDEPDPREIIKAVRPGVLVKGGDWPVEKMLGADTVLGDGGEVHSLPYVPGRSTTSIVEGIVTRYSGGFKE